MSKNVVVVGGGIAGLAASIYLARAGRTVTLFEKRRFLGGRAITTLRRGYRFNLGPHLLYRGGAGYSVYRELGIPVRGLMPGKRALAVLGDDFYTLPLGWISLLKTSLLSFRAKREVAAAMFRVWRSGGRTVGEETLDAWLDAHFTDARARATFAALIRLATYSDHPELAGAAAALNQLRVALRGAVYVDEGWQKIVDALHSAAVSSGVHFVTSSRIVGIDQEHGRVRAIELGGLELDADRMDTQALAMPELTPEHVNGARLPADTVILAVDPVTAADLAGPAGDVWRGARPVTVACLDIALRSAPKPKNTLAVGIDRPFYLGVHSASAQLTPKGGALIHAAKYRQEERGTVDAQEDELARRGAEPSADERQLEGWLDELQPGWRELLVHKRFLPSMIVSNALATPTYIRPEPVTTVHGLYIAGDWVGDEGMLSDAALASARAAARAALAS